MTKRRLQLIVAYDGTDYCGWAAQTGQRTVHGTLTEAVRQISGEETEIIGASRTDSRAHAKGQSCHFDTGNPMAVENWVRALNDRLPYDIAVQAVRERDPDFHARFWALGRRYRYRFQSGVRDPHRSRFTHFIGPSLDLGLMQAGARLLQGEHDFRAFSQQIEPDTNTVRKLYSVDVTVRKDEFMLDIYGTAFVRGMMRRMAGMLWQIGRGQRDSDEINQLFDPAKRERIQWPPVLPAGGLTLMKVEYGRWPREQVRATEYDKKTEETEE
ncbi:MAG: tRNA pseudouridine(38-40) synthase TruA [Fimbriimonadaceae bacterium]|nr:tRNA pseudouridine(38-40) synthase TruA [Fimbriimonadaceae bacterium]